MTKIIGLSGRKQSGKNTSANWIFGQTMTSLHVVEYIKIDKNGRLIVPALVEGELVEGAIDPCSRNKDVQQYLEKYVWPVVKVYSFADPLKEMVHGVFGIPYNILYGTDEDKDKPTKYTYSNFFNLLQKKEKIEYKGRSHEKISSRKILQIMGAFFRRIYGPIWVEATINKVKEEKPELAIICDVRYPNEVEGIHENGGKIIRFTRSPHKEDEHESETALDDWKDFDCVIDNENMTIEEQNKKINEYLTKSGFAPWRWEEND